MFYTNYSMRFSFDLGTNSIGWAVFETQQKNLVSLKNTGVRIFSNSRADKTYAPLNQQRQIARSARRQRDRYLQRREYVLSCLTKFGFFPTDKDEQLKLQQKNPYELRCLSLDQAISPYELGRALFHINQRRGFKSNRLSDGDDESGKIKPVISELKETLRNNKARTLGEYLYHRFKEKKVVRARPKTPGNTDYELYFSREMYSEEFDIIWEKQKEIHKNPKLFSEEVRKEIKDAIFHQRKLKAQTPGMCLFEDEPRCAWALPIAQEFRILQDLNNIHIYHNRNRFPLENKDLQMEIRNKLKEHLENKSTSMTSKEISNFIKKTYNLEGLVSINFERTETKNFKNNGTTAVLSKILTKQTWQSWDRDKQNKFVEILLNPDNSDKKLLEELMGQEWQLPEDVAQKCIDKIVTLPKDYCNISKTALTKIVKYLQEDIITYDKAVKQAGYEDHKRKFPNGYSVLPYYGEILKRYCIGKKGKEQYKQLKGRKKQEAKYGKITNPTVHVGLNQLQKVVNELIRRYGKPHEIIIELLRDFSMGKQTKNDFEKKQRERQKERETIKEILEKEHGIISPSRQDIEKYMLWKELAEDPSNRRCPYSNENITANDVFSHITHVDHILPFSRTLDNSFSNKILCKAGANKEKREKSPYEAWKHTEKWKSIHNNASYLPPNKRWRFQSDAMERFEQEGDFLAHQLTSSQYFATVSKYYLECLHEEKSHPVDIWVSPGKLSAWLRYNWGLHTILGNNGIKNRNNHKHHAIDAIVVGCIERGILQKIATWAGKQEDANAKDFSKNFRDSIPPPWEGFREDIKQSIQKILISHKNDKGKTGQLLEEQAYSLKKETKEENKARYVGIHKNILDLTLPMINKIANPKTRKLLQDYCDDNSGDIKKALQECFETTGIRRVKIISRETVIPIKDKQGKKYKGYPSAGNWGYEIYEDKDGKWQGEMITIYQANQKNYISKWRKKYPNKKMIMRLHKNDTVMLSPPHASEGKLYRVCKMSSTNSNSIDMYIAELHEANDASRANEKKENEQTVREHYTSLSKLQEYKLTKVHVSPTGMLSFPKNK